MSSLRKHIRSYDVDGLDHKGIIEKLYDMKKADPRGKVKSNAGGYHTTQIEHMDPIQPLIEKIRSNLEDAVSLNFTEHDCMLQMWGMINKKGSFNHEHSHQKENKRSILPTILMRKKPRQFIISGVYYLQIPEHSGNIIFVDNRKQEIPCTPREGLMLFFPGTFRHYVEENKSDIDRISVSWNIVGVDPKYLP